MYKLQLIWEDDSGDITFLDDCDLPMAPGPHNVETYCLDAPDGHTRIIELMANVETR